MMYRQKETYGTWLDNNWTELMNLFVDEHNEEFREFSLSEYCRYKR